MEYKQEQMSVKGMYIDQFETPFNRGKGRILSVFMILFFIYVDYHLFKQVFLTDFFSREPIYNILIAMVMLIGSCYYIILFSYIFIRMWGFAYGVEIYEDCFIAFNAFGKQVKRIEYSDVRRIHKPFLNVANNMKIVTTVGTIEIWGGMNRYGECIESIRARSKNIEEVNYGGLDKSVIWTRNNDKFEGQR